MNRVPMYIFDLDGTIALIDHRRPILDNKADSKRWDKFFEACDQDVPNLPVIHTLRALHYASADVRIFSGRSEAVRDKTVKWLLKHTTFTTGELARKLRMRPEGDYTPDDELKWKWYYELSTEEQLRLIAVFDDRQKVVDMWRTIGVACFQVAPGDF